MSLWKCQDEPLLFGDNECRHDVFGVRRLQASRIGKLKGCCCRMRIVRTSAWISDQCWFCLLDYVEKWKNFHFALDFASSQSACPSKWRFLVTAGPFLIQNMGRLAGIILRQRHLHKLLENIPPMWELLPDVRWTLNSKGFTFGLTSKRVILWLSCVIALWVAAMQLKPGCDSNRLKLQKSDF